MNDVQLYGKSRREVVSFLKEVPPPFTLVCCRHPASFDLLQHPDESGSEEEPEPAQRRALPRVEQLREVEEEEVRTSWRNRRRRCRRRCGNVVEKEVEQLEGLGKIE